MCVCMWQAIVKALLMKATLAKGFHEAHRPFAKPLGAFTKDPLVGL